MYRRPPQTDKAALKAWGLDDDDIAPPAVLVWPENRQSVRVFIAARTQWRYATGGASGLDYSVLPELWRRMKVPPADRDDVFQDLQVLEAAALAAMHED